MSPFGLSLNQAQSLLCIAGVACCVAMSMPQVHIVAYCGDLGYGAARGAEMLSLMLAFGIVSRLISGSICDRIGGLRTLLLGSAAARHRAAAVPALRRARIAVRDLGALRAVPGRHRAVLRNHRARALPAGRGRRARGHRADGTLFGMALGGWMSGKVFDLTGSYDAAFVNGIAWNLLNLGIALLLLYRTRGSARRAISGA